MDLDPPNEGLRTQAWVDLGRGFRPFEKIGGGSAVNVANRILVNRDPRIKEIILHDARDNWFAHGGDLYMYFALCGSDSRYGGWGLSEDITNLNTPKWQAIYTLTGVTPLHTKKAGH